MNSMQDETEGMGAGEAALWSAIVGQTLTAEERRERTAQTAREQAARPSHAEMLARYRAGATH